MQETQASVRVLYGDVDRMGVVHHGHYFRYFEFARTEFLRNRGMTYASVEDSGVIMPVVDATVRYIAPARYDDLLHIRVSVAEVKQVSVEFNYEVRRDGEDKVLVRATTRLACCTREGRPTRVPDEVRALFTRDELARRG
jgi:acyl-CoA thioester hydrolase